MKDPTGLVSSVFRKALRENGIQVLGGVRRRQAPPGAAVLAAEQSQSLGQLVNPLLKNSNNMLAEVLVKTAGGSFANGVNQLSRKWAGLGVDANWVEVFDGSGMSRMTRSRRTTCRRSWSRRRPSRGSPRGEASLPVAGVDGTLANRMKSTPAAGNVKAKTGSLTGVSALTGYVTTQQGRQLVFSVVQNNVRVEPQPEGRRGQIAVRLASDNGAGVRAGHEPVPQQRTGSGAAALRRRVLLDRHLLI